MIAKTYRIGDVCSVIRGVYPTLKTEPGKYPLVVTAAFRRSASTFQLEGPAVCVPLISSTGHGDAALHRVHYQEGKFALANLLVALIPKDRATCNPKYLYHLLMAKKDEYFVPLMLGTANVSLKEQDIGGVEIPLPTLSEQWRIVSRIEEFAAKVEEARTLRSESTPTVSTLMESCLSRIFENLAAKYGVQQVGELITEGNYGTSKKCDNARVSGAVPVLRIPNVASELINRANLKYAVLSDSELRQVHLQEGDILVVRTNGSADLVGRCAVVPPLAEPTVFASYLIRLRVTPEHILSDYLQLMLKHLRTNGSLIDFARTTAGQYNVSLGRLRTAQIPVPSLHEQRQVVNQIRSLEAQVTPLRLLQSHTAAELDALMPSILSKAFRGEL